MKIIKNIWKMIQKTYNPFAALLKDKINKTDKK